MITAPDELYLLNDETLEWALTQEDPSTGVVGPATGLSGLLIMLCADETAAASSTPIHASLSVSASERAGEPGTYVATLATATMLAQLNSATYLDREILEVIKGTTVHLVRRRTVRKLRRV